MQVKNYQASSAHLVICVAMLNAEDVKNSPTCGMDHQIVIIIGDEDNNITFKWKLTLVFSCVVNYRKSAMG